MKYASSMWSNMITNSKQMNKYRFKNFHVEKRQKKTQNILPIPYAFLCIVLESLKIQQKKKSKKNDTTHFMPASYLVLGGDDWGQNIEN